MPERERNDQSAVPRWPWVLGRSSQQLYPSPDVSSSPTVFTTRQKPGTSHESTRTVGPWSNIPDTSAARAPRGGGPDPYTARGCPPDPPLGVSASFGRSQRPAPSPGRERLRRHLVPRGRCAAGGERRRVSPERTPSQRAGSPMESNRSIQAPRRHLPTCSASRLAGAGGGERGAGATRTERSSTPPGISLRATATNRTGGRKHARTRARRHARSLRDTRDLTQYSLQKTTTRASLRGGTVTPSRRCPSRSRSPAGIRSPCPRPRPRPPPGPLLRRSRKSPALRRPGATRTSFPGRASSGPSPPASSATLSSSEGPPGAAEAVASTRAPFPRPSSSALSTGPRLRRLPRPLTPAPPGSPRRPGSRARGGPPWSRQAESPGGHGGVSPVRAAASNRRARRRRDRSVRPRGQPTTQPGPLA